MTHFETRIEPFTGGSLRGIEISTFQVNTGLLCNQACRHCHVESSPRRTEMMSWETMSLVLSAVRKLGCRLVDITGGAPELHPHFRRFVDTLFQDGTSIQVRTNLTVLLESRQEDTARFLKERKVRLVASLPCYLEENVNTQRGPNVFEKSVEALRLLNSLGYGLTPELPLDLVYNPVGNHLPPAQKRLEEDYRRELKSKHGISFSQLLTITNMPIGRLRPDSSKDKNQQSYLCLLKDSFNPETLDHLMCRHQINVGWDGTMFDCDFNLALGLPVNHGSPTHIRDFDPRKLRRRRIFLGDHCYGCTAGSGSSCGGALV